jgi:hypothetical protein
VETVVGLIGLPPGVRRGSQSAPACLWVVGPGTLQIVKIDGVESAERVTVTVEWIRCFGARQNRNHTAGSESVKRALWCVVWAHGGAGCSAAAIYHDEQIRLDASVSKFKLCEGYTSLSIMM